MINRLADAIDQLIGVETVDAHCDIPCKIYDPALALVAALSVVRLTDILLETAEKPDSIERTNTLVRCTAAKEAEAAKVKEEIVVIWGDYFKAPQIEAHPDIHILVHDIMMSASRCKQGVLRAEAEALVEKVNAFAEIFWQTKGVKTERREAHYPPSLPVVRPI
ncbi:MAG: superoxide dismutase, Ni [Pseudomonadota bacterium]